MRKGAWSIAFFCHNVHISLNLFSYKYKESNYNIQQNANNKLNDRNFTLISGSSVFSRLSLDWENKAAKEKKEENEQIKTRVWMSSFISSFRYLRFKFCSLVMLRQQEPINFLHFFVDIWWHYIYFNGHVVSAAPQIPPKRIEER